MIILEWIDLIVIGLVEQYGTRDVYELCDALGIEIRIVSFDNPLLRNCESHYYRNFNGQEIIFISNSIKYKTEKDFILKHELGHAVCNAEILYAAYSNKNIGKIEKQANYFAMQLSNLELDDIGMYQMTCEQIAAYLQLPYDKVGELLEDRFASHKNIML